MEQKRRSRVPVRNLTVTAMLSAVAAVLMLISFSVPLMPSFIKLDLSELPALLASFTLGPIYGAAVCLVKNLINLPFTTTGGVGELCNFLLGALFVLPAGVIYARHRSMKGAIVASLVGALSMALFSFPVNLYLIYPVYTRFLPIEAILGLYREINPSVSELWQALLIFNVPFTFVKALCSVVVTFLIYKPLSPLLKSKRPL